MATAAQIQAAVDQLIADVALFHDIVQGDNLTDVVTEGGLVPSVAKFYDQLLGAFAVGNFPGAIRSSELSITGNYTVVSADTGKTLNVSGGLWTITFGAATGYSSVFTALIVNRNALAATFVSISGFPDTPLKLWPNESVLLQRDGSTWSVIHNPFPKRFKRLNSMGGIQLYVDASTGNDTQFDGLNPSRAFAKIQKAIDVAQFECDGGVTINVAAGIHTPPAGSDTVVRVTGPMIGADLIVLQGAAPGSNGQTGYILQAPANGVCVDCEDNGILVINGFYCTVVGNLAATLVHARQQSVIDLDGCDMGPTAGGSHISCTTSASINIGINGSNPCMNIWGNAVVHCGCSSNGYINYGSFQVNIPSALSMGFWLTASNCGIISNGGVPMTYTGAGVAGTTGTRFSVGTNAVVTSGATEPGDTAGVTSFGGLHF